MSKLNFPNLETLKEKIKQGCDTSELFTQIGKSLSFLISKPSEDYTNDEKKFLKDQLCNMISLTINHNHKIFFHDSILKLFMDVIKLAISTKLNSYVILSLIPFFDIDSQPPHIFKVTDEILKNIFDFSSVTINPKVTILKPNISSINEKLLKVFFSKSIFEIALSMINTNDFDIQQTEAFMIFFTKIQFFLDERLALSLCIFIAKYSLTLLTVEQYGSNGIKYILRFYGTFINHLLPIQIDIFHLTVEMLYYQNQNQYEVLNLFLTIIQVCQITQSSKIIKKALISLLQQTSNSEIFKRIYSFFPILVQKITFTAEDLTNFVCHIRKIPNDSNTCVLCLFDSIRNQANTQINNILLGLNLINCADNDGLSNLILAKTISLFDKKVNLTSSNFKITEKMANYILSDLNSNTSEIDLLSLGYFLAIFPRNDLIYEFVMKIIEQDDFECYSTVLKRLAAVSNQFEGEKILTNFSQTLIEQFIARRFTSRISRLSEVVVNWIQNFSSVPENQIISKLFSIDYFKCPDEVPSIVSAIMSRASNRRLIRQLITKIMKDTVPEKHASWAMNMAFDAIHDERREIERIAEILFQLLNENSKRTNVIYMIYQGVLYEADFFNTGRPSSSKGMIVDSILNGQPFTFSIHPLHSARRIYTEVGKFLQKRLSNFTIYIKDKEILPDQPLSVVPLKFDTNKKLKITAKVGENENRNDYCRLLLQPTFIEFIQKSERFTALFNLMNNFSSESEILFLILNMIDNEMIKPVLSSPIQQIFKRDYFMPLVDLESFRLFPFVLDAARRSKTVYSSSYLSTVFKKLTDQCIDQVSLLMSCRLASSCSADSCQFDVSLIMKCLITSNKKAIREAMAEILTKTDETNKLLSLLPSTCLLRNRSQTKQYFSLLKKMNIDPLFVEPLLHQVKQYETDFEGNIDATINGIFSMDLNPSEKTFEKVFQFLFAPPTLNSPYLPFLHTLKSRRSAYKFILKYDDCIKKVQQMLSNVPMQSKVSKLNDNFSYYKRGLISLIDINTVPLISLYSVESIRNFVIRTKFESQILKELSDLFFEMTFTCMPSINIAKYPNLISNKKGKVSLSYFLKKIYFDAGLTTSFFDIFHIKCQDDKCTFEDKCKKFLEEEKKKILFFAIEKNGHSKFKFPLFFDNYQLTTVLVRSDDNGYSVIYRGREINDINNLLNTKDNYAFDVYNKSCWFIAENSEISKFDISELPERCFGGDKKKQSAFLLVYEDKDIDVPKIYVTQERQENIDIKNAMLWPSIVCNSREFINFARELFKKDIENYIDFGLEAFFKIAVIDDLALNDWKELLTRKVLINEAMCKTFIENFVSNKTLIKKVDLSENGTLILPELFLVAKSHYNIDYQLASKMISSFDTASTEKQFGFVCDILNIYITDSSLNVDTLHSILRLMTKIYINVNSTNKIFDRVLKCFDNLMMSISAFSANNKNNSIIDYIVSPSFLAKWLEIGKKSDSFKSILESIQTINPTKCSSESSSIISQIHDTSAIQLTPTPTETTITLPTSVLSVQNSPFQLSSNVPKRNKNAKFIKRKNRQNLDYIDSNDEYHEQNNNDSQNIDNYDEFIEISQDQNDTNVKNESEKDPIQETVITNSESDTKTVNEVNESINDIMDNENEIFTLTDQATPAATTEITKESENIAANEEDDTDSYSDYSNEDDNENDDEESHERGLISSRNDNFMNERGSINLLSSSNDSLAGSISLNGDFLNSNSNENLIANDSFMNDVNNEFMSHANVSMIENNSNNNEFIENDDFDLNGSNSHERRHHEKDSNDHLPFEFELKSDSPMSDSSMS